MSEVHSGLHPLIILGTKGSLLFEIQKILNMLESA